MSVTPARRRSILFASFLHFDVSFMCWVMIGSLGVLISKDLHVSAGRMGLLVATPILSGSVARIVVARIGDSWSLRGAGYITIAGAMLGLIVGSTFAHSYGALLGDGVLLGVSGASFSVALPLASRWFPPERQGLAMGIAGAGNSGTVIASFFAPRIASHIGWHATMGLALIPLVAMAGVWTALAHDAPIVQRPSSMRDVLRAKDFWLLALIYSVTFGGFVGLTGFAPIFLSGDYHLTAVVAGTITAAGAVAGSAFRPIGGFVADRLGGRVTAGAVLTVVAVAAMVVGLHISLTVTVAALLVMLACLGSANGAVFQMVPHRFPREIAVVAGLVGAAGGVGGFALPTLLGGLKDAFGTYLPGFTVFALFAAATECWRSGPSPMSTTCWSGRGPPPARSSSAAGCWASRRRTVCAAAGST